MNHQSCDPLPTSLPYSKPLVNRSVFSTPQIYAIIDFEQRLEEAAFFANNGWDLKKQYEFSGVYVPKAN